MSKGPKPTPKNWPAKTGGKSGDKRDNNPPGPGKTPPPAPKVKK